LQLQERATQMHALRAALDEARGGNGRLAAILGEAGIGKTSLLRAFLSGLGPDVLILRGACEDLSIAEPLGPLRDLAREAGWRLDEVLSGSGGRIAAFSQIVEAIGASPVPVVIVVEDLHWADDATVDFLKFLARRLDSRRVLLIVTARDEDARGKANIRQMTSGVASDRLVRLVLRPLSLAAIQTLAAGSGLDPQAILTVTGGNAFYVAEVTKSGLGGIPLSVEDAVLARLDGVSSRARHLAETASVFPRRAETDLMRQLLPEDFDAAMEDCLAAGLLEAQEDHLSFRHEIARLAVEGALTAPKRKTLHLSCLRLLDAAGPGNSARRLHHAIQSGQVDTIRTLAPAAAAEAMQLGAARTAAEYFELALQYGTPTTPTAHADVMERTAWAHFLAGTIQRPIELQFKALAIFQEIGDPLREGDSYRRLALFHWMATRIREAADFAEMAVRILGQNRGPELAMALSTQAQLAMLDRRFSDVIGPSRQAVALAREFARPDIEAHALNNLSQATWIEDAKASRQTIRESIDIALRHNDIYNVARGYTNATFQEMELLNFAAAEEVALRGIAYVADHELDGYKSYLSGALAWALLHQGRLEEAEAPATVSFDLSAPPSDEPQASISARAFTGACSHIWLAARRGLPIPVTARAHIDAFMLAADEMQRLNTHAVMLAELAWLGLESQEVALSALRQVSVRAESLTAVAESAIWLWRFDPTTDLSGLLDVALPYRLEATGDIAGAAALWADLGAPFDMAMALAQGTVEQRLHAIQIFTRMGAAAPAQKLVEDLRREGYREVPHRPRQSTLLNPLGLTNRQLDVLRALSEGLSNQDIGARLFVSPKTIDHHVSAILAKLEVASRGEAAAKARKLSLI
jgi:DNA-binding CsgD family transcriptional regulator/tetratricopeptide (TPR) repeat protein